MIKKILLGLFLFSIFIFGNSASAVNYEIGLNSFNSTVDNNFSITPLKGGAGISNKLGLSKGLFAFSENRLFWWDKDGRPYIYVSSGIQGFVNKYSLCNLLSGVNTVLSNCTYYTIGGDYNIIFKDFFNNVNAGDYFHYVASSENSNMVLCWSSSLKNKTLCLGKNSNFGNLTGSLGYVGLNFSNINANLFGSAPGQAGYDGGGNIEGSSSIGENTSLSGNLMYSTCTNGYVVSEMSSLYGGIDNICYAGTNNTGIINDWVAWSPISQGLNFKEVYNGSLNVTINGATPYYSSYLDWFNTWMYAMQKYKLGQISFDIFNGQPVYLYAYFDRLYQNGVIPGQTDAYNIVNICKLALFSDYNQEYKGTYFRDVCDELSYNPGNSLDVSTGEVGSIDNDLQEILPPGSDIGTGYISSSGVIVSVDWSGTLSGNTNKNFDGKTFINDFYQKLQANFQKPTYDLTGIVPIYIYVFLIALVLFRFLSH